MNAANIFHFLNYLQPQKYSRENRLGEPNVRPKETNSKSLKGLRSVLGIDFKI
jgi:hypothetical protein